MTIIKQLPIMQRAITSMATPTYNTHKSLGYYINNIININNNYYNNNIINNSGWRVTTCARFSSSFAQGCSSTHNNNNNNNNNNSNNNNNNNSNNILNRYLLWCKYSPKTSIIITSILLWGAGDITAQIGENCNNNNNNNNNNNEEEIILISSPSGQVQCVLPDINNNNNILANINNKLNNIINNNLINININIPRLISTVAFGTIIAGLLGQKWYKFLDFFVIKKLKLKPKTPKFIISKLFFEFTVWHPFCLVLFWGVVGYFGNNCEINDIIIQLNNNLINTLLMEVALWTPLDIINFIFVPIYLQVIVVNIASFFEAILLSYLHHKSVVE